MKIPKVGMTFNMAFKSYAAHVANKVSHLLVAIVIQGHRQKRDCKANINVKLASDGLHYVLKVNLQHNHVYSPSQTRFFRSNRRLTERAKKQLEYNDKVGMPLHKSYDSLEVEEGG